MFIGRLIRFLFSRPVSTLYTFTSTTLVPPSTFTKTIASSTTSIYLDSGGSTILQRRFVPTMVVQRRAAALPSFYTQYARSEISTACNCLKIPKVTVTRTIQGRPTVGMFSARLQSELKIAADLTGIHSDDHENFLARLSN
jgi:hypothetical protein